MVIDTLKKQIKDVISGIANPPKEVMGVYQSAVEHFGEDKVDLQPFTGELPWYELSIPTQLEKLCDWLCIDVDDFTYCHIRDKYLSSLETKPSMMQKFLGSITEKSLLKSSMPIYSIVVHFHNLTITNEQGDSTLIEDMYANIPIRGNGTLYQKIYWARTTFSNRHYRHEYRHSHLTRNTEAQWSSPCLGSGPIIMTMLTLDTDCSIDFWGLFWLELDNCLKVESLQGIPYAYMKDLTEKISVRSYADYIESYTVPNYCTDYLEPTIKKLLKSKKLNWSFVVNSFRETTPFTDFIILASNVFLESLDDMDEATASTMWEKLIFIKLLKSVTISSGGVINTYSGQEDPVPPFTKPSEIRFKGKEVQQIILEETKIDDTKYHYVLSPEAVTFLHDRIEQIATVLYATRNKK